MGGWLCIGSTHTVPLYRRSFRIHRFRWLRRVLEPIPKELSTVFTCPFWKFAFPANRGQFSLKLIKLKLLGPLLAMSFWDFFPDTPTSSMEHSAPASAPRAWSRAAGLLALPPLPWTPRRSAEVLLWPAPHMGSPWPGLPDHLMSAQQQPSSRECWGLVAVWSWLSSGWRVLLDHWESWVPGCV